LLPWLTRSENVSRMRGAGGDEPPGPPGRDLFERIIARHRGALEAVARKLCRNAADASDLFQDTCERALRSIASLKNEDSARAWLVKILRNRHFDRCRSPWKVLSVESPPEPPVPDEPSPWERVTIEDLHRAIEALSEPFRSVAILHDVDGLSNDEIAQKLGVPYGTVATRLHRAHERVKEFLRPVLLGSEGET
jgi:RNA polymerase sigma-70 factor (ECF subfamily)